MNSMRRDESKNGLKLLSFFIVFISALFFSVGTIVLSLIVLNTNAIHNGIYIENINVSGLTSIEATTKIEEDLNNKTQENKLQLKYGDKMWVFSRNDIGLKYDFKKAISDAVEIGRAGNYLERVGAVIKLLKEPQIISLKSSVDVNAINAILDSISTEINSPSIEAKIERKNGKFIIQEGYVGVNLNKEKTYSNIIHRLSESRYDESVHINLTVDTISPKYTSEMLSQVQDLLGSYSTRFNSSVEGRTHNIRLSSNAINGTLLLPGEVFSFNEVVGPRSSKDGYREAPVIIQGDLVDGLGGGVCQVSSTIYNTVLKSGLEVIERRNHSIPSTYVPKGLDATVSYGYLDFKFKNNTDYPIFIESFVKGNDLSINIYGYKTKDKEVKLFSRVDEVIKMDTQIKYDPSLLMGREIVEKNGRNGYRVTSYMIVYENGVEVDRKVIAKDYYAPDKRVVIRGTKERIEEPIVPKEKDGNDKIEFEETEE